MHRVIKFNDYKVNVTWFVIMWYMNNSYNQTVYKHKGPPDHSDW